MTSELTLGWMRVKEIFTANPDVTFKNMASLTTYAGLDPELKKDFDAVSSKVERDRKYIIAKYEVDKGTTKELLKQIIGREPTPEEVYKFYIKNINEFKGRFLLGYVNGRLKQLTFSEFQTFKTKISLNLARGFEHSARDICVVSGTPTVLGIGGGFNARNWKATWLLEERNPED